MKALEKIINKQLKKSGVPPIKVMSKRLPSTTGGQFDFNSWKIQMNKEHLQSGRSPSQFKSLASDLYHEARHTEQWFAAARFRASQAGASTGNLATRMSIPTKPASAAMRAPLSTNQNPMAVLGEATNRSVYGEGGSYRSTVLNKPRTDPVRYPQYRGLFEEQDAFGTGDPVDC